MPEKAKVPAIRFKGFTNFWEQSKLGELAIIRTGYPFDSSQFDNDGEYLVITNGNIQDESAIVGSSIGNRVTVGDHNIARDYLLDIGDVLVTMDGTVGRTAKVAEKRQILAQRVGRITAYEEQEFLYQWLNTGCFSNAMLELSHGGTIKHISLDEIRTFESLIAKSAAEKRKIGAFFKNLDNLITLHQRKLLKLKNVKKAMLEKMFPKNGSTIPEIRFAGFTDPWEQRKVKDACEISTGKSNTQDRIEDGIYPFYVRSPIIERSNRYLYDEEAVLTVGDGVGTGKVYHYINGKYDLHQRVYRMFDFKNGVLAKYFYHHFSNHFYDRVMAMTAKTSVDSVRYEMISEMSIEMPSEKEQAKIIDYLDNLDNLITLHQRKLEKLKNIKKACLEKMFV